MRTPLMTLLLAVPILAGCTAITSTTNTVARTLEATSKGTTQSTEGSTVDEKSAEYADARQFVRSQFAIVRREAASGGGEHTAALARLMGAPDTAAFNAWLQAHYAALFSNLSKPGKLVDRIAARRGHSAQGSNSNDA